MKAKQKPNDVSKEETKKQTKKIRKSSFSLKRKEAQEAEEPSRKTEKYKKKRRPIRRIFPIWLRLIFFILLCIGALIIGLMVGYGILGDGSPKDILKIETWQHIVDIVKKDK